MALLFGLHNIKTQREDVMLLASSELQLIWWLLVDAYFASRVLEAVFVALCQKPASCALLMGKVLEEGVRKCHLLVSPLQITVKHSAPIQQLAELDSGFR